ncbi:MAG: TCP-1/cpn60 chaperonin family protein [Vulcanimicrobiota bacterium]
MKENTPQSKTEVSERLNALITNTSAVRAITGAVEGTIGPKGLDTMLVDRSGDIIITNDGVTILDRMDVSHPAARMVINIARSQNEEIGDGTTTAVIMAGTLISEGLNHIIKGVPVTRVIDGINQGINFAMEEMQKRTIHLDSMADDPIRSVALIAGRGDNDVAEKVTRAAQLLGKERLLDPSFKFKEIINGVEGAQNELFEGIIVKKRPVNQAIPAVLENPLILCVGDWLDVEKPGEGSLNTEIGFQRYIQQQEEFMKNVQKIIDLGIKAVFIEKSISSPAEELLTNSGVMAVTRVSWSQMKKICQQTGAVAVKTASLSRSTEEIKSWLGQAEKVMWNLKLNNIRIIRGKGSPTATFIVGAPTLEVLEEKERIAFDAASAVQAALKGGVVAGGGATELAISHKLVDYRSKVKGMVAFGIDCVVEALRKPMYQIILNAGFNPLEKVEEILAAQNSTGNYSLGLNCDTGEVDDMKEQNILDPAPVKMHALKAAVEVARAILRINTIIKMKETRVFEGNYNTGYENSL